MPKLGLKYFAGSFFLSMAAVFVASKAYIVMSINEQLEEEQLADVETRTIELFSANEENDPIYEKYKKLSAQDAPLSENAEHYTYDDLVLADNSQIDSDGVLYASDEINDDVAETDDNTAEGQELLIVDASQAPDTEINDNHEEDNEEELQIADASQAPVFRIPLKHNYQTENGVVTVTDTANKGQIALASHNVSIYNMGTENQAEITDPLAVSEKSENEGTTDNAAENVQTDVEDSPWEVATTGNKHAAKNTLAATSDKLEKEVNLPDAEATQTAYKMQQNLLIPIPEDILNDENLTPQFSTSEENLRLEEELRAKNKLPPLEDGVNDPNSETKRQNSESPDLIPSIDDEKDFDEDTYDDVENDEQTSQNLKDSIAAWFSGIKTKAADSVSADKKSDKSTGSTGGKSSSIFQKLLGDKDKDVMPTELKLAFQPNRAEISGQTLDWLHAFADNAVQNENVVVEIRVDKTASPAIQQKRLTMLYKIFADNGVEPKKINIIFTDREPNSFIIRNVRYTSDEERIEAARRIGNPWYKF